MKRVFYILLIASFLCMIFAGCGAKKPGDRALDSSRFQIVSEEVTSNGFVDVILDNETGVLYLFAQDEFASGITPLLGSNGEVQFYQDGGADNSAGVRIFSEGVMIDK